MHHSHAVGRLVALTTIFCFAFCFVVAVFFFFFFKSTDRSIEYNSKI